jgi:hypothetical protein
MEPPQAPTRKIPLLGSDTTMGINDPISLPLSEGNNNKFSCIEEYYSAGHGESPFYNNFTYFRSGVGELFSLIVE